MLNKFFSQSKGGEPDLTRPIQFVIDMFKAHPGAVIDLDRLAELLPKSAAPHIGKIVTGAGAQIHLVEDTSPEPGGPNMALFVLLPHRPTIGR
jgi:hypothetical protein